MKTVALVAIIYFFITFLRKRLFLFPYFYLIGTITEAHGLSRILSNLLGEYLSLAKLLTGILFLTFFVAKKPNINFKNNNLFIIVSLVILYFNSSFIWTDEIADKGLILSLLLLGLITYVFARLCIDENIELHFIRAISLSSVIISFAALTIFFNIEFFNFLGGNYLNINSIISEQSVFRARPLNLNSNVASFWVSIGSAFIFSFYINKFKMWNFLSSRLLIFLLLINIAGLLTIVSLSAMTSNAIIFILVLLLSDIKQKHKIYFRIFSGFLVFFIFAVFTGLGDNLINRFKENSFDSRRAEYYEDVSGFGGRPVIISNSFSIFMRSPLIGNGFNSYENEFGGSTHNSFLWALTSGGIIGFALWSAFNLILITCLISPLGVNHFRKSINVSLTAICFGSIIYSLAHNIHLNKFFWLIVALAIANVSRKNLAT